MEKINLQYPVWYLLAALALGLLYAAILYLRDRTFKDQPSWLRMGMAFLRAVTVTALAALLLGPLLKSLLIETKRPIIVMAQDNSESVGTALTGAALENYKAEWEALRAKLSEQFQVETVQFGSEVRETAGFDFSDKVSNLSDVLHYLYDSYSNQNLGAVVLATDGIYNEGSNPLYNSSQLPVPIYTVALGDSTAKKDLSIRRVFSNKIAYLGDRFSVLVDIGALNMAGSSTALKVFAVDGNQTRLLQQVPIVIDKEDFFKTQELILEADRAGVQRFRIVVDAQPGEASTINNRREMFIDVLDARQKILILGLAPHPDMTALKQTLEGNKNYALTVTTIRELKVNPADFDFVVLHQLPGKGQPIGNILQTLESRKIPHLFITGLQSDFQQFNQAQSLLRIAADGRNTNDVQGYFANGFSSFNLEDNLKAQLPTWSPLLAPFGEFTIGPATQSLLYQRIGKVETGFPLWVIGEEDGIKKSVLCAEGIWRWRLFDYLQNNNHNLFNELLGKVVQFVALKEDKRKFRTSLDKNIFNENEPISIDAELYNDSYELVNDPDPTVIITDGDGKEYNFNFNKSGKGYQLEAGIFPVGNYRYKADVNYQGQNLSSEGVFSVQPIELELYNTTADHNMLRLLSRQYGGEVLYPGQLAQLETMLQTKGQAKPVMYQTSQTKPLIHLKWIFFLLLALLTMEWFARRYFGAY